MADLQAVTVAPRPVAGVADGVSTSGRSSRRLITLGASITIFVIVVALVGPLVAPFDPVAVDLTSRLQPPSAVHVLGTDQLGRDVLSRILYGGRVSLVVATAAVAIGALLGTAIGMLSGYLGGRADMTIMRVADMQLAFPIILLALIAVAVLGPSIPVLVAVFVIAGSVRYVRVVRADTLVLRGKGFAEAAQASGATSFRILRVHYLPNLRGTITVLVTLEVGRIILLEAALSFLGLGIQPPVPTWGNMINEGRQYIHSAWWIVTFPGIMIALCVLGVNLLGEGIRNHYDARQRR